MKIAFITVHRVKNYGSALLCYATQHIFEQHGFDVEFIDYARMQSNEVDTMHDFYLSKMTGIRGRKLKDIAWFIIDFPAGLRVSKAFVSFRKKYLHLSEISYRNNEKLLKELPPVADIYCTGGDQMWNEQYNFNRTLKPFYLDFAPEGAPRISFSTSIGKTHFDKWEIPEVVPLLNKYQYISVREETALNALTDLGIKNVTHIQDPTFLIESKAWDGLASSRLIKEPYILFYRFVPNEALERKLQEYAVKTHRKIYYIENYSRRILPQNKQVFVLPEPEEFLSLIKHADYVVTDSFHGTVFSIKFKKQFLSVFANNPTRLASILTVCGLKDRQYIENGDIGVQLERFIDYEKVDGVWKKEREKADVWIENIKSLI